MKAASGKPCKKSNIGAPAGPVMRQCKEIPLGKSNWVVAIIRWPPERLPQSSASKGAWRAMALPARAALCQARSLLARPRLGRSRCSWRAPRQKRCVRPISAIRASTHLAVIPIWQFAKYGPTSQNARLKDPFLQFLPLIAYASGGAKGEHLPCRYVQRARFPGLEALSVSPA